MDKKQKIKANMWVPICDIYSVARDCYMRIQDVAKILCVDKDKIEEIYNKCLTAEQHTMITPDGKWSESGYGADVSFNYDAIEVMMECLGINNAELKEQLYQSYKQQRYNSYMD